MLLLGSCPLLPRRWLLPRPEMIDHPLFNVGRFGWLSPGLRVPRWHGILSLWLLDGAAVLYVLIILILIKLPSLVEWLTLCPAHHVVSLKAQRHVPEPYQPTPQS